MVFSIQLYDLIRLRDTEDAPLEDALEAVTLTKNA